MATLDFTQSNTVVQPPKSGDGFLTALLDSLDDGLLLETLQAYRRTGRPGYPLRAMWRAYLLKFVLNIRYNNQLVHTEAR